MKRLNAEEVAEKINTHSRSSALITLGLLRKLAPGEGIEITREEWGKRNYQPGSSLNTAQKTIGIKLSVRQTKAGWVIFRRPETTIKDRETLND